VDVQRVERVADFMGDAGGEQGQRVEALRFEGLLGFLAGGGEVADQHDPADGGGARFLGLDGGEVEVEVAVFRVEDLEVARDRFARLGERGPVESGDAAGERGARGLIGIDSEEAAGGAVDEGDLAVFIEHDDAFVERLEDLLEETLLADQAVEQLSRLGRVDPVDAGEEFVEEAGFQGIAGQGSTPPTSLKLRRPGRRQDRQGKGEKW
jgi:hypothetical protein